MKLCLPIFLLLTVIVKGQSIDIEKEHFRKVRSIEVSSFNSSCAEKGFRAVYVFDSSGCAIESQHYFKRELRAKYKYLYNSSRLLTQKIQVFDINNKIRIDSTHYYYTIDTEGKISSKTMIFGMDKRFWQKCNYSHFDKHGFPETVVVENEHGEKSTDCITYDTLGHITLIKKLDNDSLKTIEERKYNSFGDVIYSNWPPFAYGSWAGGSRYSVVEIYEYTYDKQNRWTEKYVICDGKKILLDKRKYR